MTVNAITDTKKGRTGIAPTYLHTTQPTLQNINTSWVQISAIFQKAKSIAAVNTAALTITGLKWVVAVKTATHYTLELSKYD